MILFMIFYTDNFTRDLNFIFQHWSTKATVCLPVRIMRRQESIIRRLTMWKHLALKLCLI